MEGDEAKDEEREGEREGFAQTNAAFIGFVQKYIRRDTQGQGGRCEVCA